MIKSCAETDFEKVGIAGTKKWLIGSIKEQPTQYICAHISLLKESFSNEKIALNRALLVN